MHDVTENVSATLSLCLSPVAIFWATWIRVLLIYLLT